MLRNIREIYRVEIKVNCRSSRASIRLLNFPLLFFFTRDTLLPERSQRSNRSTLSIHPSRTVTYPFNREKLTHPPPSIFLFHYTRTENPLWFPRTTSCLYIPRDRSRISFVDTAVSGHFLFLRVPRRAIHKPSPPSHAKSREMDWKRFLFTIELDDFSNNRSQSLDKWSKIFLKIKIIESVWFLTLVCFDEI